MQTRPRSSRYVVLLIGVLILMWGITTAGLVWRHWSEERRSEIANGYHLASAEWAGEIERHAAQVLASGSRSRSTFQTFSQAGNRIRGSVVYSRSVP